MPRRRKRSDAIELEERDFSNRALPLLREVARGLRAFGLFDQQSNPYRLQSTRLNSDLPDLRRQAQLILRLRSQLGAAPETSLAAAFLDGLAQLGAGAQAGAIPSARAVASMILERCRIDGAVSASGGEDA